MELLVEKKIIRYIGSNTIWSIKFIGSIEKLKFKFPFAIFVNTKYQSVHGVSISIKNPIRISIFPFKNRTPRKYPRSGVQIKLIIRLVDVNLTFLKLFFKSLSGTSRNSPYNIKHKNKVIKDSLLAVKRGILLNPSPNRMAKKIIAGSPFSKISIYITFLGVSKFLYLLLLNLSTLKMSFMICLSDYVCDVNFLD